jgi:hypothetical protein
MKTTIIAALAAAAFSLCAATAASARDGCGRGYYRDYDGWCQASYRVFDGYRAPIRSYRVYESWRPSYDSSWADHGRYDHHDFHGDHSGYGFVDFGW